MNISNIAGIPFDRFNDIVLTIYKKYRDLNNLLSMGFTAYERSKMIRLVKRINPLYLNTGTRNLAGILNPYRYTHKEFTMCVSELIRPMEPIFMD